MSIGPERDPRDSTLSSGTRSMLEKLKESTQVKDTGCWMLDTGNMIQDTGYMRQDT